MNRQTIWLVFFLCLIFKEISCSKNQTKPTKLKSQKVSKDLLSDLNITAEKEIGCLGDKSKCRRRMNKATNLLTNKKFAGGALLVAAVALSYNYGHIQTQTFKLINKFWDELPSPLKKHINYLLGFVPTNVIEWTEHLNPNELVPGIEPTADAIVIPTKSHIKQLEPLLIALGVIVFIVINISISIYIYRKYINKNLFDFFMDVKEIILNSEDDLQKKSKALTRSVRRNFKKHKSRKKIRDEESPPSSSSSSTSK